MKRLIFSVAVLLGLSGCAVVHDPYYYSSPRVIVPAPVYVPPPVIYRYHPWHGTYRYHRHF